MDEYFFNYRLYLFTCLNLKYKFSLSNKIFWIKHNFLNKEINSDVQTACLTSWKCDNKALRQVSHSQIISSQLIEGLSQILRTLAN